MKTNNLRFIGQIRKGNLIITTCVDANNNEYRFAKLVKNKVSNITTKIEAIESKLEKVVEEVREVKQVIYEIEDDLEVPYFMNKEYRATKKRLDSFRSRVLDNCIGVDI